MGRGVGGIKVAQQAFQCIDLYLDLATSGKDQADTTFFSVINRQKIHKAVGVGFVKPLLFDRFDVIDVKACMDTLVGMVVIIVWVVVMITFPAKSIGNQMKLTVGLIIVKTCNRNQSVLETGRKDI